METINNDILSDGFRLEGSWASDLKDALKKNERIDNDIRN